MSCVVVVAPPPIPLNIIKRNVIVNDEDRSSNVAWQKNGDSFILTLTQIWPVPGPTFQPKRVFNQEKRGLGRRKSTATSRINLLFQKK